MITLTLALCLSIFPLAYCASDNSKGKLVFAHVIYRHGDRSPGKVFPNDLYGEKAWPQGMQELSTKGMLQHYLLGKYLRKRYSKLLSKRYVHKEIYIRSSDKNRALQSAASNLAGLYPPAKDQVWNPKLDWQPVPIHSVPTDDDNLLVVDNPCPTYDQVFQNQSKPIIDQYNKQYATFFEYLKNNSGMEKLDFWSIGSIYDPLYCELQHGMKLPKWAEVVVNKTTGQTAFGLVKDLKNLAKNLKYNSDEKAKLTGGYLLGDILERLQKVAAGPKNSSKPLKPTKLVMYSAHDDTLMALLYALNVADHPFLPPYASAILIDLYQSNDGTHHVEVAYKNNTPIVYACKGKKCKSAEYDYDSSEEEKEEENGLLRYTVPGCPGFRCPLDTFVASLSARTSYPQAKRNTDCGIKETRALLRPSVIKEDW